MDESRKQFEEWFDKEYRHLESSQYTDIVPHIKYGFWMAWQASRQTVEVELSPRKSAYASGYGDGYLVEQRRGEAIDYDETVDALRAAGLKIKGE